MKRKPKAQLFDDEHRQEILNLLPVVISGIEVQVKDTSRVSVFADDTFLLGLPVHVSNRVGLKKGTRLDEGVFLQLEAEIHRDAIRSWLLGLLAKKAYSKMQLMRKCKEEAYPSSVVSEILEEFESRRWIDDKAYALSFCRDKFTLQKWGPAKIRQHLQRNGINAQTADQAIRSVSSHDEQLEIILALTEKRKLHFMREEDLRRRKKKIVDYLLRKGYDGDVIFGNIDAIMESLNT